MTRCRLPWPPSRRWPLMRPRSISSTRMPGWRKRTPGAPHVLVVRTPHRGLTWLRALGSRQHAAITAILAFFTGFLISDGYGAYQELLPQLAGVQQCCQHVIRRCRAVTKLGPGGLQSWAADVIDILREAHQAVRGSPGQGRSGAGRGASGEAAPALRRGGRLRDHAQPAPGLARRQPPRLRPRLLAARLQGAGLAVHPRVLPSSGRTTAPSRPSRPPSGTRPSPGTGTPREPSPAGAAFAATSTRPRTTDSPRSTPSPVLSQATHGFRLQQPETTAHVPPLNGHNLTSGLSLPIAPVTNALIGRSDRSRRTEDADLCTPVGDR